MTRTSAVTKIWIFRTARNIHIIVERVDKKIFIPPFPPSPPYPYWHSLPTLCCSSRSVVCNNLKYSCLKHRRPSIVKRADILNFRKLFLSSLLSLSLSLEKSDKKLQIYHFVSSFFFFFFLQKTFFHFVTKYITSCLIFAPRLLGLFSFIFFFLAPRGFFEPIFHSHSFSRYIFSEYIFSWNI